MAEVIRRSPAFLYLQAVSDTGIALPSNLRNSCSRGFRERKLQLVEAAVGAQPGHQLFVPADVSDRAVFDDQNTVGAANG